MRVAITGATGNVGTSLIEALAADDGIESIVGIARRLPSAQFPKTTWYQAAHAAGLGGHGAAGSAHGHRACPGRAGLVPPPIVGR